MLRGLNIAATGMLAEMNKQDLIANNLANVETNGFKRDVLAFESFPMALVYAYESGSSGKSYQDTSPAPIGYLGTGVGVTEAMIDYSQGAFRRTENELDFALMGDGFFAVQTPDGERYTRNGNFMLDAQGQLVNSDGYPVLGQNGTIQISGTKVSVDESGNISVDGQTIDSFKLVVFSQSDALEKVGHNLFAAGAAGAPATDVEVAQGCLEASNVNVVKEMVEMIATLRAYEANQRVIRSQDEMLGKAVNEVGKLA